MSLKKKTKQALEHKQACFALKLVGTVYISHLPGTSKQIIL